MAKRTVLIVASDARSGARLLASVAGLSTLCLHARSAREAHRLLRALAVDVMVIDAGVAEGDELAVFAGNLTSPPRVVHVPQDDPPPSELHEATS